MKHQHFETSRAQIICLAASLVTTLGAAEPRLQGIVSLEGQRLAMVDFSGKPSDPHTTTLRKGQWLEEFGVIDIDERAGQVALSNSLTSRVLQLK